MRRRSSKIIGGGLLAALVLVDSGAVYAQDFFSNFFRGFNRSRVERSYNRMPFAYENPGYEDYYSRRPRETARYSGGGGSQAFCVRTCDGRHFPVGGQGEQSKAATCSSLCPASETKVFYGSNIDNAVSDKGASYSNLPNAFKYRTEIVAGCTCNGTPTGLAPIKVEDDPTLKRGDIVAGADGLLVTRGAERRGASLELSPASPQVRARYERTPIATD